MIVNRKRDARRQETREHYRLEEAPIGDVLRTTARRAVHYVGIDRIGGQAKRR